MSSQPPSNHHLKPPSAIRSSSQQRSSSSSQQRSSSSSHHAPSSTPRPPLAIHPTTTIADTVLLHGTHQISIGAGAVIHPRARLYSYEGPLVIGDGCIIGEKSVIGSAPTAPNTSFPPPSASSPTSPVSASTAGIPIRLSSSVTVAPLATILPGAHVRSASVIDSLAIVHRNAVVGSHSRICSGCEVPENGTVGDWTVVWGTGNGFRQRRRKRVVGTIKATKRDVPDGRVVEDARLMVLQKEREGLVKMIGLSAGGARKR